MVWHFCHELHCAACDNAIAAKVEYGTQHALHLFSWEKVMIGGVNSSHLNQFNFCVAGGANFESLQWLKSWTDGDSSLYLYITQDIACVDQLVKVFDSGWRS